MPTDRTANDDEVGAGYRPVSVVAVAAAIAGAASALALVSPALWAIPLLALGLAWAAFRDLGPVAADGGSDAGADGGDRKTGRWLALAGLALATGFGAQAVAGFAVGRAVATRRAEAAARMFVEMVREDRMADALKCCLPQVTPPPSPSSMRGTGGPPDQQAMERQAVAALRDMEVIREIRECGDTPVDVRCTREEPKIGNAWVLEVRVGPCANGKTLRLKMLMQSRAVTRGQRPFDNWMVAGISHDTGQ